MIRQHDVQILTEGEDGSLVAQGTFRVVLTRNRRVVTAIDVPDSALGPLHLVFAVSPESMLATATSFQTAGFFDDMGRSFQHVGHDVGHAFGEGGRGDVQRGGEGLDDVSPACV